MLVINSGQFQNRRSFYSYLGRLQKQGLLERHPDSRRGYLAYRLTPRGQARLEYFRRSGTLGKRILELLGVEMG